MYGMYAESETSDYYNKYHEILFKSLPVHSCLGSLDKRNLWVGRVAPGRL